MARLVALDDTVDQVLLLTSQMLGPRVRVPVELVGLYTRGGPRWTLLLRRLREFQSRIIASLEGLFDLQEVGSVGYVDAVVMTPDLSQDVLLVPGHVYDTTCKDYNIGQSG